MQLPFPNLSEPSIFTCWVLCLAKMKNGRFGADVDSYGWVSKGQGISDGASRFPADERLAGVEASRGMGIRSRFTSRTRIGRGARVARSRLRFRTDDAVPRQNEKCRVFQCR